MSLSEFSVNVHNEIMSHLQSFVDPDEIDDNCEVVFKSILSFSSTTITPGREIHQKLMDLWISSPNSTMSHLINNTILQLYRLHKPGSHPILWNPVDVNIDNPQYFSQLIRNISSKNTYSQQYENAIMILKYYFVIFEYDFRFSQYNSTFMLTKFIETGRTKNLIINSVFECVHNSKTQITEALLLLQCYLDIIIQLELTSELIENDILLLISGKFTKLKIKQQELFLQSFPDGMVKMRLLDNLIESYGILTNNAYSHLKGILPNTKKLSKYHFQFEVKSKENLYIFILLISNLTQLTFQQDSTFSKIKLRSRAAVFISNMMKQVKQYGNSKNIKLQMLTLDLLIQGYCRDS